MEHSPIRRPHFFFTTAPMACPYLPGKLERKIVTELTGADAQALHDSLSRAGFRRSHSIAYAPACEHCAACIPVRVVVDDFKPSRNLRKVAKANADLSVEVRSTHATTEQYRLFSAYQKVRHGDSDMAHMGFYDYRSMVEGSPIQSNLVEFRSPDGTLVATCLMDTMDDGLSAVYSFFETDTQRRSLGTYAVLWMIEEARKKSLPYVYLGYWIEDSGKMAYKTKFAPLEGFSKQGWNLISR